LGPEKIKRFWVQTHWCAGGKPCCWPSATELDFGEFPTNNVFVCWDYRSASLKNNPKKPLWPLSTTYALGELLSEP